MNEIITKVGNFYRLNPFPIITPEWLVALDCITPRVEPQYDHVLSVGCGTLQPAGLTRERFARSYTFTDISSSSLEIAQGLVSVDATYACGEILTVDLAGGYDAVICTGMLHHHPEPRQVLERLRELVKPGAELQIMVYNADSELRQGIEPAIGYTRDYCGDVESVREFLTSLDPESSYAGLWYASHTKGDDQLRDTWLHPYHRLYDGAELEMMLLDTGWIPQRQGYNSIGTELHVMATAR